MLAKDKRETAAKIMAKSYVKSPVEASVNAYIILVCTENSDSNVLVMQAADQGMRYDASGALNRARDGRVLV